MRYLIAALMVTLVLEVPRAHAFTSVYDSDGKRLRNADLVTALVTQVAAVKLLPAFPSDVTAMRASYETLDRSIYAPFEAHTLFDILIDRLADETIDTAGLRAERQERLRDAVGWGLWLISREAVNYQTTVGQPGPWEARRLRGWGKKGFVNKSGGFSGWHTFAEQTAIPLIGLFQAAEAIRRFLKTHPALANAPVFDPASSANLRKGGYLLLLPPALSDVGEIEQCRVRIRCRWDATAVTWNEAADAFEAFSGAVLGWWRAHAMSRIGSIRYFWYTAVGDAEFAGTGIAARQWFVVHANMLMGRAAYLYGRAVGEGAFSELAAALLEQFAMVHYSCTAGDRPVTCYHYAVRGLDWNVLRQAANSPLSPDLVPMAPPRSLEEPFHRNASHALVGLLAGDSLVSRDDGVRSARLIPGAQTTYLRVYAFPSNTRPCGFLLPAQCAVAPVQGPPTVTPLASGWSVKVERRFVPEETLVVDGAAVTLPDYRNAQPVAMYYLAEGASDELFDRLVLWWDAFGRRNVRQDDGTSCQQLQNCPSPFKSANFRKMAVFLAAEALRREHAATPRPQTHDDGGGCQTAGPFETAFWVVTAWAALYLLRGPSFFKPVPIGFGAHARQYGLHAELDAE